MLGIFENTTAAPEYVNSKTAVWWDMDTCPVPDGYDARRVRPSIEWALKDLGFCGPVTITALGNLEKIPPHVLQGLSSTGILVQHAISYYVDQSIFGELMQFKSDNPPPATIMLISDNLSSPLYRDQQIRRGYNLVLARTFKGHTVSPLYHTAEWVWKTLLAADSESQTRKFVLGDSASIFCISCRFTAFSVTDFTSHLSTEEHTHKEIIINKYGIPHSSFLAYTEEDKQSMAKGNTQAEPEYVNSKTVVWWDMDTCPVPGGYDARRVRPSIESALMDLGYCGPVTITAKGNLEKTPPQVLQGLSSTGILVQHTISGKVSGSIFHDLLEFKSDNPAPATIMLISDTVVDDLSLFLCRHQQKYMGYYNHVLARTYTTGRMSHLYHTAEWLWGNLLKQETRRFVLQKCSESGDSASLFCISCGFTAFSVTDLMSHLSTEEHKQREIRIIKSSMPESEEDMDSEEEMEEDMDFEEEDKQSMAKLGTSKHFFS